MRPDLQTLARAPRRTLGLAAALLLTIGLLGCGGAGPEDTPAISGGNPAEITVPTVPGTTEATATTIGGGVTTLPAGGAVEDPNATGEETNPDSGASQVPTGNTDANDTAGG